MRADLEIIQQWIEPNSRVLDLGCGDGALLQRLKQDKNVSDCGLEIDPAQIRQCLALGINVIEQDLDQGLSNFESGSFDTVVLAHTLQAVHRPDLLVEEMLRVGRSCIITFPNFAYWPYRLYLLGRGRMPVSRFLPYAWYDTPNIHFCTVRDFDTLCAERGIRILHRTVLDDSYRSTALMTFNPNFFGMNALYHISR
ncbi:MAG: methionine biosynthesis protein MetW [Pseudomonadales bacterium]|nr:methionine biosynthesis protein MetW [Pseudomonadales bacterium]